MEKPRRGDIYYIHIPEEFRVGSEEHGAHWHVVVSRDEINHALPIVLVVSLTSLSNKNGVPKDNGDYSKFKKRIPDSQKIWIEGQKACSGISLALTEQVFTISQEYLVRSPKCGKVTEAALGAIEEGLIFVFKLSVFSPPSKSLKPPLKQR